MRAAVCRQFGGPDALAIADQPEPLPKPGELLVRVKAAGVNHADLVVIAGKYQVKQEPPFIPGMEIAGEVAAVAEGVIGRHVGERVVALIDNGGYAEYAAIPARRAFPIPDGLSFEDAAGTFVNYGTAHAALRWRAALRPGETCLVLGGAGSVGLASIAIGKAIGARVIGAASSPERCAQMAANGADETIDYANLAALRERLLELTGKRGADVIVDPVGGEAGALALRCVAWGGRIVTLGFAGGQPPQYPANILLVKNAAALGLFFGSYFDAAPELLRAGIEEIQRGLIDRSIRTYDIAVRQLDALPEVLEQIRARKLTGKAVLKM